MDPMTLALIGTGVQAGGNILGGFFGGQQKKNEAAVSKYNAAVSRMEAQAINIRTKYRQQQQAEEAERVQGYLRAAIGGSGAVATQGANLAALGLQKMESSFENYLIGYEGRVAYQQAMNQALEYDMRASMLKIGARQDIMGGFLGAGVTAAYGLSQLPEKKPGGSLGGGGSLVNVSGSTFGNTGAVYGAPSGYY